MDKITKEQYEFALARIEELYFLPYTPRTKTGHEREGEHKAVKGV
jgi:hypothetical protein